MLISRSGGPALAEPAVAIFGAHTDVGCLRLSEGVETFGIFFEPLGLSRLFAIPARLLAGQTLDATTVLGIESGLLWEQIAYGDSFQARVQIVENFLLARAGRTDSRDAPVMAVAQEMVRLHGMVRLPALAERYGLSIARLERCFSKELGMTPKAFARVARFRSAVDMKLAAPQRTWREIAYAHDYHDQMHMIHDFKQLSGDTPSRVLARLGDGRPSALWPSDPSVTPRYSVLQKNDPSSSSGGRSEWMRHRWGFAPHR
jgi:AraC-like DNA-binding protein